MFFLKNPWPKQPPNSCQELGSMRTTLLTIYPNKMSSWRPKPTFLSGKNIHSDSHLCFGQQGMFLLTRVWRFYTSSVSQYVFLVTLNFFISNIFHITSLVRNCIPCQGMFLGLSFQAYLSVAIFTLAFGRNIKTRLLIEFVTKNKSQHMGILFSFCFMRWHRHEFNLLKLQR